MRFKVYREGYGGPDDELFFDAGTPKGAAERYIEAHQLETVGRALEVNGANIIVEPADSEADETGAWRTDRTGPFEMYRATVEVLVTVELSD